MASIVVTAMPFAGHARPIRAVTAELVRRGHSVRAYTGRAYVEMFESVGARGIPWRAAPDFDERDLAATFPRMRGRKGPRQVLHNLEDLFIGTAAAQTEDLLAAYEDEPWDVLVGDPLALGTRFAAERTRSRWATLAPVPAWLPGRGIPPAGLGLRPATGATGLVRDAVLTQVTRFAMTPVDRAYQRARAEAGLPGTRVGFPTMWYSPQLLISPGAPSLDYPRTDLPGHVRFVGDLMDDGGESAIPRSSLPAWWDDVESAQLPVVHVTQGTANVDPSDLIRPTIDALADEELLLVVGLGHRTAPLRGALPGNVRVAEMIPYQELLPRTSVVITNGGFGGVVQALRHDVPLVVAGGDLDKPEIAARIDWLGAGVDLGTGTPRPRAIKAAYRRVSTDASFRSRAARLGADLRALGGARAAAHLIEGMR